MGPRKRANPLPQLPMIYLDFEEPIRQLREQLASIRQVAEQTDVDMQSTVSELEEKIREVTRTIYGSLSAN